MKYLEDKVNRVSKKPWFLEKPWIWESKKNSNFEQNNQKK